MLTIYHNPRCSKSREALALLQQHAADNLQVIDYMKTPPSAAELNRILKMLNIPARDLLRNKEAEYLNLQLDNVDLSEAALIDAMVQHPKLIERPIVINGERAAIGRPLTNISAIL